MKKSLLILVVSAALTAAAFAASGKAQKPTITVGDFAVKVASAIGKPAGSPKVAIDSLKFMGVKISNANAKLTEGAASRILGALGMSVTTNNPDSELTAGKVDQLVALVSTAGGTLPGNNLPTQCLESRNRGFCENCCKEAFGCPTDPNLSCEVASGCAKFCKAVLPPGPPSPSDPID